MGGGTSLLHHSDAVSLDVCVKLVMPLYYTHDAVEEEDLDRARVSWHHIIDDTSPAFIERKTDPNFQELSCLSYFFNTFYGRLFDVHPACRSLFKNNIQTQGKALAKIISFLLSSGAEPAKLHVALNDMALRHVTYGVKAHEYGIMGEVLLHSLAKCVGPSFDEATINSWVRIYCMVITHVVPVHVKAEIAMHRRHSLTSIDMEGAEKSRSSIVV